MIVVWRSNTSRTAVCRPPCVFHSGRHLACELRDVGDNRARSITNLHDRQVDPGLVVLKLLGRLSPALARFCVEACGCTSVVVEAPAPRIATEWILSAVWARFTVRVRPASDLTSIPRASLGLALLYNIRPKAIVSYRQYYVALSNEICKLSYVCFPCSFVVHLSADRQPFTLSICGISEYSLYYISRARVLASYSHLQVT
eukprot:COSAG02_NODE_1207_length_13885_cov_124.791237_9_plen_201_part_00